MSRGKSQPKPQRPGVIYLNVDLTTDKKKELVEWATANPDIWDLLTKTADSTIRIGLSYDSYNDCQQCTLTRLPQPGVDEPTLVLVGRSDDLVKATYAALFKYLVILQGDMQNGDIKNPRGRTDWMS